MRATLPQSSGRRASAARSLFTAVVVFRSPHVPAAAVPHRFRCRSVVVFTGRAAAAPVVNHRVRQTESIDSRPLIADGRIRVPTHNIRARTVQTLGHHEPPRHRPFPSQEPLSETSRFSNALPSTEPPRIYISSCNLNSHYADDDARLETENARDNCRGKTTCRIRI